MCYRFYSMHVVYQLNLQLKLSFLLFHFFFFQLVKIAASGWVYGLTCCCDEEPAAPLWTEARLAPWLAGVLQEFSLWSSLLHLLPEKWQLSVPGGPVHMPTLALGWTCRALHGCWGPFLFSPPPEYHQHVSSRTEEPLTCCWELFFSLFL